MKKVYIIGSGIVGISCALNLLEKKFDVTLIEKNTKTKETSFGNAGVITRSSAYLINNKNLIPSLKKYIFNRHPAVQLDYLYLAKNINWSKNFLTQSLQENSEKNIKILDNIIKFSLSEHKKWLTQSGQIDRLRENGFLKVFRKKESLDGTSYEQSIYKSLGIDFEIISKETLKEREPALKPIYAGAMHITAGASVDNPGEVVDGYRNLYLSMGGKIEVDTITKIAKNVSGFTIHGNNTYAADVLVLAAGPYSNDLLKCVQKPIPMCFERGYHEHYASNSDIKLTHPVYDVDGAFVITPTNLGYRLTSGSELKDKHQPLTPTQLKQVRQSAHEALSLGEKTESPIWMGNRPTLPDSLPVIGQSPQNKSLWLAFGHQHIGFSTGPITGRLMAEMIANEQPLIDTRPFSPDRFIKHKAS